MGVTSFQIFFKDSRYFPDIFQIFFRYFPDIFIYALYMLYDLYTQITYNSNYYILKIDILRYTYINVCIILY